MDGKDYKYKIKYEEVGGVLAWWVYTNFPAFDVGWFMIQELPFPTKEAAEVAVANAMMLLN